MSHLEATTARFGTDGILTINSRSTIHGYETVALQTTIDGRSIDEASPGTYGGEGRNALVLQPSGGYVGFGTETPSQNFHFNNGRFLFTDTMGDFTGLHASTSVTSRAQLVMNSHYSDLVLASEQNNGNGHGSTLTFCNINPSDAGDYRKFVIGYGNYTTNESRHRLYFGYQNATNMLNPHSVYGHGNYAANNVMHLEGDTKQVHVYGSLYVNGTLVSSSDDRLKTNEEYITNATSTLLKLKPQIYVKTTGAYEASEFNEATVGTSKRESGLIAQDMYYDTPELRHLVSYDVNAEIPAEKPFVDDDPTKDPDYSMWGDYAGVDYNGLIAYLVQSVKENEEDKVNLRQQLQAERSRNDALEERLIGLETAIQELKK